MAAYDNSSLYTFIKELEVVDKKDLDLAYEEAKRKNELLGEILLERDLISDDNLGKIVANLIPLPYVRFQQVSIPSKTLQIVPEVVARKQKVIVFKQNDKGIHIAMCDPGNTQIASFISKKTGFPVTIYYATERDIIGALSQYKKDAGAVFEEVIQENVKRARGSDKQDPPIIKIVNTIISYANINKASDVHIEPLEDVSLVRFRIDGILHDIAKLPKELHPQIVTRIKVMARLRTDEHQTAQDGKIQQKMEEGELDIRVSIVPITDGEKIVMRLLSERSRHYSLVDLGFSPHDLNIVERAYKKPYGMIVATGPTGSGKTTTMYSVLKQLNKRDVNIMTIEDPVEYDIQYINQIQTNDKTGLSFAAGLRSIVRQDPDIVLVGEIRDEETAGIAINASMTGHLVLSTLHTNDAATAIPRFIDMKVEPFLVGSTVNIIIAQRLIRKICLKCRVSQEYFKKDMNKNLPEELIKKLFKNKKSIRAYKGKGCQICHETGYIGRIGIYEVLEVDDHIREAIIERADSSKIHKIAVAQGMTTMLEDGVIKVRQGITTVEEVIRMTKE